MWILASLPFWALGGLFLFCGVRGIYLVTTDPSLSSRANLSADRVTGFSIMFLVLAGLTLLIAAKVAS